MALTCDFIGEVRDSAEAVYLDVESVPADGIDVDVVILGIEAGVDSDNFQPVPLGLFDAVTPDGTVRCTMSARGMIKYEPKDTIGFCPRNTICCYCNWSNHGCWRIDGTWLLWREKKIGHR